MFDQFERSLFLDYLWNNAPRFPFFIYLYVGWILFLDLDLVSSREEKRKRFSKMSHSIYRETMKHFVIILRLVFPRYNDFSRSNVFDRNTAGYPLFLSFDSPFPSPERTHSAWFKTIRRCITSTNETVSPFRQHMFRPPTDVLSLKFPLNITSLKEREQFQ